MTSGIEELRQVTKDGRWRKIAASLIANEALVAQTDFETYWIEGGHHIREQLGDDRALSKLLRVMLTPYSGGGIKLYRGENQDRLAVGALGFAWTSDVKVAEMFATGLNAVGSGGVLLSATLESPAIISGPNAHSSYLGEDQFTVDPFCGVTVQRVASFAPRE